MPRGRRGAGAASGARLADTLRGYIVCSADTDGRAGPSDAARTGTPCRVSAGTPAEKCVPRVEERVMSSVTTTYKVSGMTCGHCEGAVSEEISRIEGVSAVQCRPWPPPERSPSPPPASWTTPPCATPSTRPGTSWWAGPDNGRAPARGHRPLPVSPRTGPRAARAASEPGSPKARQPESPPAVGEAGSRRGRHSGRQKAPRRPGPPTGPSTGRFHSRSWIPPTGSWPGASGCPCCGRAAQAPRARSPFLHSPSVPQDRCEAVAKAPPGGRRHPVRPTSPAYGYPLISVTYVSSSIRTNGRPPSARMGAFHLCRCQEPDVYVSAAQRASTGTYSRSTMPV